MSGRSWRGGRQDPASPREPRGLCGEWGIRLKAWNTVAGGAGSQEGGSEKARPYSPALGSLLMDSGGVGVGGGFEPCSLGTPRPSSAPTPYSPSPPVQNGVRYFTHSVETEQPVDGWGFLSPMHLSRSFATGWWPS